MNSLEMLLKADENIFAKPTQEKEIKRLSKTLSEPFIMKLQGLDNDTFSDIQKMTTTFDKKGRLKNMDTNKLTILSIVEGTIEPNLKDQSLLKHFKCNTPEELVKKLFLPGEILEIYSDISDLTGMSASEEDVENIKN